MIGNLFIGLIELVEEPKKEEYEDEFEREVVKWLEKKVKEIEEIEKENKNGK